MPTVANLPGADLDVTFPSGKKKTVFMPRMLVQTQNAEFKVKFGVFLPTVGKLKPTVKSLVEEYELDWFASEVYPNGIRTWEQCAVAMRHVYDTFQAHIEESRARSHQ